MQHQNLNIEKMQVFSIGEVALKLGVTIRTLQYYDRLDLVKPSAKTSKGKRFYTKKRLLKK